LAQFLVERGEPVFEVNSRWTALGRKSARSVGKTDVLDAHAVAGTVLREANSLPKVTADDVTVVLDLLVSERESAIVEATRLRNQLHALLGVLDPGYERTLPPLKTKAGLEALLVYSNPRPGAICAERSASVRRLAERLQLATDQSVAVGKRIREIAAAHFEPLTEICGVSLLTAGALAGVLGPGRRFATDAELAAYAGAAPLEASSAGKVRHRLNRGGNRQLNAILYRIVLTQSRVSPEARRYIERRREEGRTRREAVRALKRYVVRAIWRRWQECLSETQDLRDPLLGCT
jgi:transposase